jgi:hypothetical protein
VSSSIGSDRLKIQPARTLVNVLKRDGTVQPFSQNKLVTSITRAGATQPQATLVVNRVVTSINTPTIATTQLSSMVSSSLSKVNTTAASQYTAYSAQKYQTAATKPIPTSTATPIPTPSAPLTPKTTSTLTPVPTQAPKPQPAQTTQPIQTAKPTVPTTVATTTSTQSTQASIANALHKPDLVVEDAFVSDLEAPNPEGLCKYQKLFLHYKIRNAGLADAVFECHREGRPHNSIHPIHSIAYTTFASVNVLAEPWRRHESTESHTCQYVLGPGQSLEFKLDLSEQRRYAPGMKPLVPGGMKPGQYAIKIIADPNKAIDELSESNNECVVSFTVNPDYPPPINYIIYLQSLVCLETEDDTEMSPPELDSNFRWRVHGEHFMSKISNSRQKR